MNKSMDAAIQFVPCRTEHFEEMLRIRIDAMRPSLERLGRFDVARARARLERSFYPEDSEFIVVAREVVGYYTLRPAPDGLHLEHFYLLPSAQARGIGSFVLRRLLQRADQGGLPIFLGALKQSPANRFYVRHGFVANDESEWDIHYVYRPTRRGSLF